MKTIGIDIGTTNTKAILCDAQTLTVLGKRTHATPTMDDGDWGTVRDPDQIFSLVVDLIKQLGVEHDLSEVAGISVSSVGEEIVLLRGDNRPVCPIIPWFDPRSWTEHERFLKEHGTNLFNGAPPGPWYSIFKLLWVQRNHGQIMAQTKLFTDIASFVLGQLSETYTMDWSHASRTGAFDLISKTWNLDVIRASGLKESIFPKLVPSGSRIARIETSVAEAIGLPPNVAICSGGHDHFCAAYAGGVREAGDILVSAGTSEACFILLEEPVANLTSPFPAEQGCFVDGQLYYIMISIPSGHQFQQWKSLLYAEYEEETILDEMESLPREHADIRFTMADNLETWTLSGSGRFLERGQLMRAIQEGLAAKSRDVVNELFSFSGRIGNLFVTGKPAFQPFWRKLRACTYQRDLYIIREMESASLGAAILASKACGDAAPITEMVECFRNRAGGTEIDALS